jgi:uncharacterized protein YciI
MLHRRAVCLDLVALPRYGACVSSHFLLFYEVVDDYIERRAEFRAEHLALAKTAAERGELLLAGAYADPADGALLVFRGADAGVASRFAEADPYVKNGLVRRWWVRNWTVVVGSLAGTPR